ncbi:hypothetical protein HW932_15345 [Allochromatium humboldtianum]|uniref:Uncharacterized protein n=1 Tax=Allochromatium humboldtianum TaxID=504901 RepID=A0A850RGU0_9GAMM|nr:hypothetical protein [Allochromatium humboldtianum]NVZ10637.1 hypothetical protein [Allochromatium humboldtianum]
MLAPVTLEQARQGWERYHKDRGFFENFSDFARNLGLDPDAAAPRSRVDVQALERQLLEQVAVGGLIHARPE